MAVTTLLRLEESSSWSGAGGKAEHLHWLLEQGERVPPTIVVFASATEPIDRNRLRSQLPRYIDPDRRFAIRSSANVEDGAVFSFAGQFTTHLDVSGLGAIVDAIADVAESTRSESVATYVRQTGRSDPQMTMAVLVQEMVPAKVSGVAFSRNPVTGLDEVIVEAVRGPGTVLVAEGVTPDRWIHRWGSWTESPGSSDIPEGLIAEVVERTRSIAGAFGRPVDLEWVFDGVQLHWVQLRAITGISDLTVYSNRIAREVLPGLIKPLVWSVNVPMVNRAWIRLFTELVGDIGLEPDDLARSFGYRAYFNMSAIGDIFEALGMPRDSLELLLGLPSGDERPNFRPTMATMRHLPRMLRAVVSKTRIGRVVDSELPVIQQRFGTAAATDPASLADEALLGAIADLDELGTEAAYLNIVTPLAASISTTLLRRALGRTGVDFAEIDLTGDVPEMRLWSPNPALDDLAAELRLRSDDVREHIDAEGWSALPDEVRDDAAAFVERFGHLSESGNDFSAVPWREDLDLVARLIAHHEPSTGSRLTWHGVVASLPRPARRPVDTLKRTAVSFVVRREAVSSTYTFGYGQFRRFFLECGRRLVAKGLLDGAADVMYLTRAEVESALRSAGPAIDLKDLVAARRAEMDAAAEIVMPDLIFGDDYVAEAPPAHTAGVYRGVATSRGRYRGRARVINGQESFHELESGEVLVIPYSDVGWTPLFARAGAVVAEAGGMLSHASIVAREYGLPCVVSVAGATRIRSGAMVTVDGHTGEVAVES